jgi:hypothetical protein
LEELKEQVQKQESLAHITQAEGEAVKEFDNAIGRIELFLRQKAESDKSNSTSGVSTILENVRNPSIKPLRVIKPTELIERAYLESQEDIETFLTALRSHLEDSLARCERIQVR